MIIMLEMIIMLGEYHAKTGRFDNYSCVSGKKYINQCLDSVINQTYDNYEIIIIDDGSTDGSGEICDDYAMENPSIKVFHQANQGVTIARKRGLGCSSGKYIFGWMQMIISIIIY